MVVSVLDEESHKDQWVLHHHLAALAAMAEASPAFSWQPGKSLQRHHHSLSKQPTTCRSFAVHPSSSSFTFPFQAPSLSFGSSRRPTPMPSLSTSRPASPAAGLSRHHQVLPSPSQPYSILDVGLSSHEIPCLLHPPVKELCLAQVETYM